MRRVSFLPLSSPLRRSSVSAATASVVATTTTNLINSLSSSSFRFSSASSSSSSDNNSQKQQEQKEEQKTDKQNQEEAAEGGEGEEEEVPRKRRFRIGAKAAEERQKTFHQGSGSFLAGFSSVSLISLGCAFLFVPLYRLYCSPQGRGADPKFIARKAKKERDGVDGGDEDEDELAKRKKLLTVRFLSDVGNTMPIAFVPLQRSMEVLIGEPALAFYSAYNKSSRTLLGVSTYTISPPEGMAYLNKIQCFCFEEQRFKPHELVEMPVFFYIDKDFLADPVVSWLDEVILNYTFFNLERTRDMIDQMHKK